METCPSIFALTKSQNFYKMTTHHTEDRLQHYEFDQYTVTTNFATYEDAVNYANEHQGELVEVGFTDGSDNPTPNDSAKLVESKKPFNPNSAIEKKEYFSILISNCVAVEKNKR